MTLRADSPEFAELASRWMDDTATEEEAELLWRCITESPECAAEFAAISRFDGLLADTVKARDVEIEARKVLAVTPRTKTIVVPRPQRSVSMRGFAIAAVLVVMGLITAMLWPSASVEEPKVVEVMPKVPVAPVMPPALPKFQPAPAPALDMAVTQGAAPVAEVTLTERLDDFFLNGVALDRVPLSQALATLQQQLVQADYLKTLPLSSLRVTVPAGAAARRVTFQSATIPYLKAVRAVAALAGCDVEVEATSITLILQQGIFPQVTEKRALGDLLAGRLTPEGTAMAEDEGRVAALWEDTTLLGLAVMEDGSASISRGQWEALRQMTDSRDALGSIPMPTFALYVVPEESAPPEGVMTQQELQQFQLSAEKAGFQPVASLTPDPSQPEPGELLAATVTGDSVNVGPQQVSELSGVRSVTTTLTTGSSMDAAGFSLRMMSLSVTSDLAIQASVQAFQANGIQAAVIAVPVQPTTQPTTPPAP
jgi:hypothetical protein